MKKILLAFSLVVSALFFFDSHTQAQTAGISSPLLRHIVIITFKEGVSSDSIKVLDDIYTGLSKSPLVKDFETGVNVSPRDSGIVKHIYVTTFASREDMKSYAKIPEYSKLFRISLPIAEDVTVADYWIKK
jgi:hypothetical protein